MPSPSLNIAAFNVIFFPRKVLINSVSTHRRGSEVELQMGRKRPCCEKGLKKRGLWTAEEDQLLISYIKKHGQGDWCSIPKLAGLTRCGKSCRLRWTNYLRPDIRRGPFTDEEEKRIIHLHSIIGNKWAAIAKELPGRTDNEIKNLWNTSLRKRLITMGLDPQTHQPLVSCYGQPTLSPRSARHKAQWESAKLEAEARLSKKIETPAPYADPFLRLWNSEVGEAFRKIPTKHANHSFDSIAGTTVNNQREIDTSTTMAAAGSVCSSTVTYQNDDSSVSTFRLLMDLPFNNETSKSFFADHFIF